MSSVVDLLKQRSRVLAMRGGNVNKQKNPSGHGQGKWENKAALARYRKKRDAKRRGAR